MGCIIYSHYWLRTFLLFVVNVVNYIRTSAWGFRRCSFRQSGQCEGLYGVERATGLTPRLFILSNKRITFFFSPKGSKGMLLRLWNLKTVEKEFLKIRFYVQFTEIKNRRTTFPEKELHFDKRLLISERIYTYCYQNIFSKWRIKF